MKGVAARVNDKLRWIDGAQLRVGPGVAVVLTPGTPLTLGRRHVQLGPGRKSVSRMQAVIVQTSESAVRVTAQGRNRMGVFVNGEFALENALMK